MLAALNTRVFIPRPAWNPPDSYHKVLKAAGKKLGSQLGQPLTYEEVIEVLRAFPPKKREMYSEALLVELNIRNHSRISAFVKLEFTLRKKGKFHKPRAIQFRDPVYLAHFLKYCKPLEHALYHGKYLFNPLQKYTCAKGFNPHRRAKYVQQLVREMVAPVYIGLDGSAWDAHMPPEAIRDEFRFYTRAAEVAKWPAADIKLLKDMGRAQEANKCRARLKDGTITYKTKGNRASGDGNTGLGNSAKMMLYTASLMEELKVPYAAWRMFDDGDDTILLIEQKYRALVVGAVAWFMSRFSQEMKVSDAVRVTPDSMEAIEFCQARMVNVDGEWEFVRDPFKVYNCYTRQTRWYATEQLARRFMASVALPEMIINADVPVLDAMFACMHKLGRGSKPLSSVCNNFWRRNAEDGCERKRRGWVAPSTRASFAKAFGISPVEQVVMEQMFEKSAELPEIIGSFIYEEQLYPAWTPGLFREEGWVKGKTTV